MFFYQRKEMPVKKIKIRNKWGVLKEIQMIDESGFGRDTPRLTDQELADQLEVGLITVITHRRD
jgi:hypothetical protein